jgi:hypothetical protein
MEIKIIKIYKCGVTKRQAPIFFNSPYSPNRLRGPPNLPSNEYKELTTRLQLVPMSRKHGSIHALSHTSSWRSAKLVKHRDKFILPFFIYFCRTVYSFTVGC